MSQRLNRKEIKRDEFAQVVGRGVEYAESHSRILIMAIGGVLAAVAIGLLIFFWMGHHSAEGQEALGAAIKVIQAPVDATNPQPSDPKQPTFATEAARQTQAEKLFKAVRNDYPRSNAADVAGLYLGEIAAAHGQYAEARTMWTEFVDKHGHEMLGAQARLDLIELDRTQGQGSQVVQNLRAMMEQSEAPLPQDVILLQLARTLEDLHRDSEAIQSYQRLVDEYPQSSYRQEAQQRLTALDPSRTASRSPLGAVPGLQR
jgi:lipopolysaccharide biosynthesis regulator YciM